jgi:hypothetical protein
MDGRLDGLKRAEPVAASFDFGEHWAADGANAPVGVEALLAGAGQVAFEGIGE